MTTVVKHPSPLLGGIDRAIALVEAEAQAVQASTPEGVVRTKGGPAVSAGALSLDELDLLAARLRQIHDLFQRDPRLVKLVDDHIGRQVRQMERRQWRANLALAAITTLIGVILGWLFSALLPPSLLTFMGH